MFDETSNDDLINYLKMLNLDLNMIVSAQDFNNKAKIKSGLYILNVDRDLNDESRGTHWTCFYCYKKFCIYFDSYGMLPNQKIIKWMNRQEDVNFIYNRNQIQSMESLACGYFCIYALWFINEHRREMRSIKACHRILSNMLEDFDYNEFDKNDLVLKDKLEKIFI